MKGKDNLLKKEFQKKDVERLRNLVKGKYGNKINQGVGYTKKQVFHEEGDIWEEDGRKWTIKEGLKQNITKMDKAKKYGLLPIFCPCCEKPMNYHQDKKFYFLYKRCFNCQVNFEADIKQQGLWEEYETNILNADVDGFIKEYTNYIKYKLNESNMGFVTESGEVERWVGKINKEQVLQSQKKTISYLKSLKK